MTSVSLYPHEKDIPAPQIYGLYQTLVSQDAHMKKNQVRVYPQSSFKSSGLDAEMEYGDSQTGTFARGVIGNDTVDLAGTKLQDHYFAAINMTNTSVLEIDAAGILGLGFPVNRPHS
jgi:phytepsin